ALEAPSAKGGDSEGSLALTAALRGGTVKRPKLFGMTSPVDLELPATEWHQHFRIGLESGILRLFVGHSAPSEALKALLVTAIDEAITGMTTPLFAAEHELSFDDLQSCEVVDDCLVERKGHRESNLQILLDRAVDNGLARAAAEL